MIKTEVDRMLHEVMRPTPGRSRKPDIIFFFRLFSRDQSILYVIGVASTDKDDNFINLIKG